jgi:hypothetical protein
MGQESDLRQHDTDQGGHDQLVPAVADHHHTHEQHG